MTKILIVGAGFSGAVVARELAEHGFQIEVIDARPHIGGNCHTRRDPQTGVMEHVYGPHIFNTSEETVWNYVQRFCRMRPFVNRVKASIANGVFQLPVNLHTINQFFGTRMGPDEARRFIESQADTSIAHPRNFEEQAMRFIGKELYEAFFKGYTEKQWGCHPRELPASILQRLPVRFNYDDNYYSTSFQGIPENGYTALVEGILEHPGIQVRLGVAWDPSMRASFADVVFTGPIDEFFGYRHGRLGYRTVFWTKEVHEGDFQGNAVINYPGLEVPYTRIHEHKHFASWENHSKTVVFTEFSKETGVGDIPYYPKRLNVDIERLGRYVEDARAEEGVHFLGRLATYRYMDMDDVIGEALQFSRRFLEWKRDPSRPRPFFHNGYEA